MAQPLDEPAQTEAAEFDKYLQEKAQETVDDYIIARRANPHYLSSSPGKDDVPLSSSPSDQLLERLPKEVEEGNIEYKARFSFAAGHSFVIFSFVNASYLHNSVENLLLFPSRPCAYHNT